MRHRGGGDPKPRHPITKLAIAMAIRNLHVGRHEKFWRRYPEAEALGSESTPEAARRSPKRPVATVHLSSKLAWSLRKFA